MKQLEIPTILKAKQLIAIYLAELNKIFSFPILLFDTQ